MDMTQICWEPVGPAEGAKGVGSAFSPGNCMDRAGGFSILPLPEPGRLPPSETYHLLAPIRLLPATYHFPLR